MPYLGAYANINELVTLAPLNLAGFITARAGVDAVLYGWYPSDNTTPADGYTVISVPDTVGRWKTLGSDISIPGEADQVIIVAANFSALPDATDLSDGATAFIQSRLAYYSVYRGAWIRLPIAHPSWRLQEEWSINSSTGSDDAAGTLELPIATFAEFLARMGSNITINNKIHVYFQTDTPSLNIDAHVIGNSEAGLFFHGKRTVVGSGTFTNGTETRVTSTNTPVTVVDTEQAFGPFVGNLIVITAPPSARVGATSVILSASGITAITGTFSKFNPATAGSTPLEIVPEPGDVYEIFECSAISEMSIRAFSDFAPNVRRIWLDSFNISLGGVGTFLTEGCSGIVSNCTIDNFGIQTDGTLCTRHNVSDSSTGSVINGVVSAGAFFTDVTSENITLNLGVTFQNGRLIGSNIITNDVQFIDWSLFAIKINNGELFNSGVVWGSTSVASSVGIILNPNSGIKIISGFLGGPEFVTSFPINPTSNDFTVNGLNSSFAFDLVTATYISGNRLASWANVDATIVSGGFEGHLVDPRNRCYVIVEIV